MVTGMQIYLIGIGMGEDSTMTIEAKKAIQNADVIIGAKRMTCNDENEKQVFNGYKPAEIVDFINKQKDESIIAVLLSGDVGFYSGAKKLLDELEKVEKTKEVTVLPGISSVVYFCAKLHTSWDDVKLLSLHGKNQNIIGYVKRYSKVFALLSGKEQLKEICAKLKYYHMDNVKIHIGQKLSYEDERIFTISPDTDIFDKDVDFDNLAVVLIENDAAVDESLGFIEDEAFIRGEVPMTKSEVRSLSISKLCLKPDSILYDVGAGTGSVSIEAALKLIDGKVYAIERHEKAVELINQNKQKFAADNIEVICGLAPEAFRELPPPTHVFIGGSAGNMEQIIDEVMTKNPKVKVVINAIALNTVGEVVNLIGKKGWKADITGITVAKNKVVANYQMMMGQNPVYVICIEKD